MAVPSAIEGRALPEVVNNAAETAPTSPLRPVNPPVPLRYNVFQMIPELSAIPYHSDLMALEGVTFEDTEQGRVDALMHLVSLLAFSFRGSPVRKQLTLIVLDLAISHERKIEQVENPTYDQKYFHQVIFIKYDRLTAFFNYSLSCLFEARAYVNFVHLLKASEVNYTFNEKYHTDEHTPWYSLPHFKESIAELFTRHKEMFENSFFYHAFGRIPSSHQIAIFETLLKDVPGGKDFILRVSDLRDADLRVNYFRWTKFLFSVDYSDNLALAEELYLTMQEILEEGGNVFYTRN